jgi:hypothetical protein
MNNHDRENMRLDLEAETKWEPLNTRKQIRSCFIANVLIGIFILTNIIGLCLWIYHVWMR